MIYKMYTRIFFAKFLYDCFRVVCRTIINTDNLNVTQCLLTNAIKTLEYIFLSIIDWNND